MIDSTFRVNAAAHPQTDAVPARQSVAAGANAFAPLQAPWIARAIGSAPGDSDAFSAINAHAAAQASFAYGLSLAKSGPLTHFDSQLTALYMEHSSLKGMTAGFTNTVGQFANSFTTGADGKLYVTIDATAADGNGAALLHELTALGFQAGASYGNMASGKIAVDHLGALLHAHDLDFASESAMFTRAGIATTQAVRAEQTDVATDTYGVTGAGVRVGILSDSFDAHGIADNMASNIASDDLPADTTILEDIARGSDEGRGMGQLVHDLATGAAIDFATAFTGQAGFAKNIIALAHAGDQIIVDDVGYLAELAYQDGPIAQAIAQVTKHGVMYFSAAGNDGNEGLEQNWVSGLSQTIGGLTETFMQFDDGEQDYVTLKIHGSTSLVLQWDNPSLSAGNGSPGATSDLDLFITDASGSVITASSTSSNIGHSALEKVTFEGDGTYYVRVGLNGGPAPTEIKLMALYSSNVANLGTTSRNFNDGTLYGHAAAPGAIAVGAAAYDDTPAFGKAVPKLEYYSSSGPSRFWYDEHGVRLATPDDRATPQITAVDGGDTTAFFGHYDPDGDGHPNFYGTSAAAPDAAAVAALMLEANAGLTSADVLNLLKDSSIDMNDPTTKGFDLGSDRSTGSGLIQADRAVAYAETLTIDNPGAVQVYGTHFSDTIVAGGQDNLILAGTGDDRITGGIGADTITGGAGNDTFIYTALWDSNAAKHDLITDLQNSDTINVSAIDADGATPGVQGFTLVAAFDHHAGEAVLEYHTAGAYAGQTTLSLYTNTDDVVDGLIVLQGDHHDFANIVF